MSLIADGLLIATCFTAALYCYVLSRRLKQFSNTGEGIGQQILQLNATLEETRGALKEAQGSAKKASDGLAREVAQARKVTAELKALCDTAASQSGSLQKLADREQRIAAAPLEPAPAVQKAAPEPADSTANGAAAVSESTSADKVIAEDEVTPQVEISEETWLEEMPSSPTGTEQLGFVPDLNDESDPIEEVSAEPTGEPYDEDAPEMSEDPADEQDTQKTPTAEVHPGELAAAAAIESGGVGSEPGVPGIDVPSSTDAGSDGLLRVERMAI